MAIKFERYPWFTIGKLLAFFALLLVVLLLLVPGMPAWTLTVAVLLLALGVMIG